MSDEPDRIDSISLRVDMLFTYQMLVLGALGFLVLHQFGSTGEGANVFLVAAAGAFIYGALSGYHPAKRLVKRVMSR